MQKLQNWGASTCVCEAIAQRCCSYLTQFYQVLHDMKGNPNNLKYSQGI